MHNVDHTSFGILPHPVCLHHCLAAVEWSIVVPCRYISFSCSWAHSTTTSTPERPDLCPDLTPVFVSFVSPISLSLSHDIVHYHNFITVQLPCLTQRGTRWKSYHESASATDHQVTLYVSSDACMEQPLEFHRKVKCFPDSCILTNSIWIEIHVCTLGKCSLKSYIHEIARYRLEEQ